MRTRSFTRFFFRVSIFPANESRVWSTNYCRVRDSRLDQIYDLTYLFESVPPSKVREVSSGGSKFPIPRPTINPSAEWAFSLAFSCHIHKLWFLLIKSARFTQKDSSRDQIVLSRANGISGVNWTVPAHTWRRGRRDQDSQGGEKKKSKFIIFTFPAGADSAVEIDPGALFLAVERSPPTNEFPLRISRRNG